MPRTGKIKVQIYSNYVKPQLMLQLLDEAGNYFTLYLHDDGTIFILTRLSNNIAQLLLLTC